MALASCADCKSTILTGGMSDGPTRYCSKRCHEKAMLALAAEAVSPDQLAQAVQSVHAGRCPQCAGPGPVDVHSSHFVWSALVMTVRKSTPQVSCRPCARKRQIGAAVGSAFAGWWGFPWGIVFTPIQIARNVSAMTGGPPPNAPSADLERMVRTRMGARMIAGERQKLAAEGGMAPPTALPLA